MKRPLGSVAVEEAGVDGDSDGLSHSLQCY